MSSLLQDFRYSLRMFGRSRGFALVVVLTLGLGIGANTAFFSVVNAALIRPLGYANEERLVMLHEGFPRSRVERFPFSALDFEDLRSYNQSFESVAAYRITPVEISGAGVPERVDGAKVSANLFEVLGVRPAVGRTFRAEEDRPGINVAILSWGLWQRRFAGNPAAIGQTLQLDRQSFTVVGVMPATFAFPRRGSQFNSVPADIWMPIAFTDRDKSARGQNHSNSVVARLKDDVPYEAARAELEVLSARIGANYPPMMRTSGFDLQLSSQPLREAISGRLETPLLLLLAAVGLVLLMACANVANLILSRMAGRAREFAVRTALGCGRSRLVQLLLTEATLLCGAGGLVAIVIASWAIDAAPAVIARAIPGVEDVTLDWRVLTVTGVLAIATAIAFTLVPLVTLDSRRPGDSLHEGSARTTGSVRKLRLQRAFVVSTVALAFVLLVGAGLFMRSFSALVSSDLGFTSAQVLTTSMTLPRTFYTTGSSIRTFHESFLRNLSALPGVRSVGLTTDLPLTRYEFRTFTPENVEVPDDLRPTTNLSWVHGPYFETLGMTLRAGRFFNEDEYAQHRAVVIVNERLAQRFWPGQEAVGKRLRWGFGNSPAPWLTIVGVIADVADGPVGQDAAIHAYEPFRQFPDFFLNGATNQFGRDIKAAILADGDPRALTGLVRAEVAKLDQQLAVESIELLDEQISTSVAPQRLSTTLVGAFAGLALLLASIGLYGLLAFTTTERRREIAVRLALGAEQRSVMRMIVGQGARLVAFGLAIGLAAALGLTRLVTALLYRTSEYDLPTFAMVPAVLLVAALAACALPAWRASRVEPLSALRSE
jgi:putative ABC transport system permease protein